MTYIRKTLVFPWDPNPTEELNYQSEVFREFPTLSSKWFTKRWTFVKGKWTFIYWGPSVLQMLSHFIFRKGPDGVIAIFQFAEREQGCRDINLL